MTLTLTMANLKPNNPCTMGTSFPHILYTLLNTFQLTMVFILFLFMFDVSHTETSKHCMQILYVSLDRLMICLIDMLKNVSMTLQWRMYIITMYYRLYFVLNMIIHKTADFIMSKNNTTYVRTVVNITIYCTKRPRQHNSPDTVYINRETLQNASTYTQTVNDHDNCSISKSNTITCTIHTHLDSKNNLNPGIFALPQTFQVFLPIYDGDLDSTSGTSKYKQTHVVIEHMTHRFQKSTKNPFLSVMLKNLYGHTAKDLYFLKNITVNFFCSFLKHKTAAKKMHRNFTHKTVMMARLSRTLFRTARFILKHVKSKSIKFKSNFMIKHTI